MSSTTLGPELWEEVLNYWFQELKPLQWFRSSAELDNTITSKYATALEALASNPYLPPVNDDTLLACGITSAHEVLAAIIITDQFSRNIHRGSADAFATDHMGLALSNYLIATGALQQFETDEIQFAVMPHMHAESEQSQASCVQLFTEYDIEYGMESAIEHQKIIERFGRFPHRNAVLNRESTDAEKNYLVDAKAFGQASG